MKHLLILSSLLLIFSCSAQQNKAKILNQQEFSKELKAKQNAQLIDVRTPGEYQGGHLDGARNIDYLDESFATKIETLDKNRPVFVYCQAGGRSGRAASMLVKAGFKEVYDLRGGYGAWKK
ncbi:MAG: rhodanese-like domain-containing protein [Bacteroidetes bacterium]|nr:MAG: rhodanese-like domain-containing protein [Bacteroidota bacterium]